MNSKEKRDELRKATNAATPGDWRVIHGVDIVAYGGREIADCEFEGGSERELANAEFIAATDPSTITKMLDLMDEQDEEIDLLRNGLVSISEWTRSSNDFERGMAHAAGYALGVLKKRSPHCDICMGDDGLRGMRLAGAGLYCMPCLNVWYDGGYEHKEMILRVRFPEEFDSE